jgi:hypothetical protein
MAGARGEETIQVGDHEVRVLFTNRALAEVEGKLGQSIIKVLQDFTSGEAGITELVHLLRAGMEAHRKDVKAGGRMVSIGDAFEVFEAVGFQGVAEPVLLAVAAVLNYGASDDETEDDDPNVPGGSADQSTGKRSLKTRLGLGSE